MKSNIQEQLRARKLKPSENSWEVLDARLEQDRKKSSNKKLYLYVAASVAVLFTISLSVFRNGPIEPQVPVEQSVEQQNELEIPISNPVEDHSTNETELIAMPAKVEEVEQENTPSIYRKSEAIASRIELNKEELHTGDSEPSTTSKLIIDAPVVAVKEGVTNLENREVSDEELESLLTEAQNSMDLRKQIERQKSDADWLLVEVEMELDHNFKDKVFNAIKNAVKNPKNTITRRDN